MKKGLLLGSMGLCLAACGAPDDVELAEQTAETAEAITIPDDPLFPHQWGLRNTGQLVPWTTFEELETFNVAGVPGVDINAALAWDITQGASDILIGVAERTDVGIHHEDLVDQIFRNRNEIAADGIDNDGNGCIDDDHGCDFVNQDGVYTPTDPHASHVAGIIGGRIKNGKGIAGVAPKAKLVPLTSLVEDDAFIAAIDYAEANGIRVMNLSQGGTENFDNPNVRARMSTADILFACSAGNRGTPRLNFPSSYSGANILAVSNVTNIGEISDHSSYGPDHVDLAAPGRSILSSINDDGYDYIDGTSQAAPHVAGVAALVMKRFPNLTVAQVADRLTRTAMRMTPMTGMVRAGGMVDARAALEDVGPIQPTATSAAGRINLSWAAQPGATRYDVERDGTVVSNGTATTHSHTGLTVDSGHIYRVRAITGSGTGPFSYRLMAKASTMPASEPYVRESLHPYPNDTDLTFFRVRKPGATRLRVHFSRVDVVRGDALQYTRQFVDERESNEENISGSYPTGFWTHWLLNQDTFEYTFRSDAAGNAFGYSIDRIEYFGVNRTPTQIAIGTEHGCVRVSDGAVRCWGENGRGQLGIGRTDESFEQIGDDEAPAEINDIVLGGSALSVSAGHEHNCAVLQGGGLRCWGFGTFGRLGYGNVNTIGDDETPASAGNVPVGGSVVQVSAGNTHTCALLSGGAVRCWGNGANGRLGYGNLNTIGDNETPASAGNVNVGGAVAQIAAGGDHTCALLTNGAVRCWGANGAGQLGYGNTNTIGDNETPASAGNVNLGGTAVAIDLGLSHSCALLTTGQMRCWGNGAGGVLGYANTNNIGDNEAPATAGNVNVGGTVASISVSTNRTCAVLTTGGMRCWGFGAEFPLGYGNLVTIGDNETPASAGNLQLGANAQMAAAGEQHICALLVGGEVRCWGDPGEGRLGLPDFHVTIGDNELPTAFPAIEVL